MRNDPIKNEYLAFIRTRLIEKWNPVDYIGSKLTASGLKDVIKKTISNGDTRKKEIVVKFLGSADFDDYGLMNRTKCIENFYCGRSSSLQPHGLSFIVDFFEIEVKTLDDYKVLIKKNKHPLSEENVKNKTITSTYSENLKIKSYQNWQMSPQHFPSEEDFLTILSHFYPKESDGSFNAFILACMLHYGHKEIEKIAKLNRENSRTIDVAIDMLAGYGIRVAWRSEYALSLMNCNGQLEAYLQQHPHKQEILKEVKDRLENNITISYLQHLAGHSNDYRIKEYARQVLAIVHI